LSPGVEFKAETPIMMDATVFLLFHASVLTNIRKTIEGYLEAYLEEHVLWKKLILSKIPYSHTACMSLT